MTVSIAAASHDRASAAIKDGRFADEYVTVEVPQRKGDPILVETDEGVRPGTTAESLSGLRPAFEADGSIIKRNTLRKDNEFFSWDLRISKDFAVGGTTIQPIFEVFNLTNSKNIKRPEITNLLFSFDGTVQSGFGDPRQVQLGVRVRF